MFGTSTLPDSVHDFQRKIFLMLYSRFDLTTHHSCSTILAEIVTNHILAENIFHDMVLKSANRHQLVWQSHYFKNILGNKVVNKIVCYKDFAEKKINYVAISLMKMGVKITAEKAQWPSVNSKILLQMVATHTCNSKIMEITCFKW